MPITDVTMRGRAPRLGTITLGRSVPAKTEGRTRPQKTATPCFHTDDELLAKAVQQKLGGVIHTESNEWAYDVEVDGDSFDAYLLPGLASQWLEQWRTAQCVRRCDGEQMTVCNGERLQVSRPCMCEQETDAERACKPHSIVPVLVELDADRYAPWDIRSTAWASAGSLKGTLDSVAATGLGGAIVPVTVRSVETKVRDPKGGVQTAYEWQVTVNVALRDLPALQEAIPGGRLAIGDKSVDPSTGEVHRAVTGGAARAAWDAIVGNVTDPDELERLRKLFVEEFGTGVKVDDLRDEELQAWIDKLSVQ